MYNGSALQHELATVIHQDRIDGALKRHEQGTNSSIAKRRAGGNRMLQRISEQRTKLAMTSALVGLVMAMSVMVHTQTSDSSADNDTRVMSITAMNSGPLADSSRHEGVIYLPTESPFAFLLAGLSS